MKALSAILLVSIATSLLVACHHRKAEVKGTIDTEIRSYADVAAGSKKYSSIIVSAPSDNMLLRGFVEDALANDLRNRNVVAIQFTKLFPPTRQYSDGEVKNIIVGEYDFAAILIVSVESDQEKDVGVATSTATKSVGGSVIPMSLYGMAGYGGRAVYGAGFAATSSVSETNEDSFSHRLAGRNTRVNATLYEASTGQKAWVASLSIKAEEGSDRNSRKLLTEKSIAQKIAKEIASSIRHDGLVRERP